MKQRLELTWFNKDKALIPTEQGHYGYTWVSPNDPRYCQTHYLDFDETITGKQTEEKEGVIYSERASLEPQEDNLLILGESGDVLEVLTRVPALVDKYVGKVKCVYIDPPFNTSQTFSNYEDNLEHSIWLTMMRDRLYHLKKLLSEDGSIWVHLDDVENHRMRVLMDEVFGSDNFVAEVIWKNGVHVRNDAKGMSSNHDVIYVYSKQSMVVNKLAPNSEMLSRYKSPDGDPNSWQSIASGAPGAKTHQGMVFGIQHPLTGEILYPPISNCWRYGQDEMLQIMQEWAPYRLADINDEEIRAAICDLPVDEVRTGVRALVIDTDLETAASIFSKRYAEGNWPRIYFTGKNGEGKLRVKGYMPKEYGRVPFTLWDDCDFNDTAKRENKALFPGTSAFATPKPERLLERVIHIATKPGDIVLDVFAGSGTTAAVAQKMGRRWVTCELVEDTFTRFTKPRLEKVVRGEDSGGVTVTKGEREDATINGLPTGISAEDAQTLTSLINKAISNQPELKKSEDIFALKSLVKTVKKKDVVNWRGGGGFTVAKLSPTCFDYNEELDLVTLTEHATGQTLIDSVAAQLRFYLTPRDRHFHGQVGIQHLVVIEGVLDNEKVDDLMSHLPQGHCLVFAATIINEDTRDHVRSFKNGSRVISIPHDLFTYSKNQEVK